MVKVTVLMSTYNGESFLSDQLASIRDQVGVEVALVIRDDGSVDRTLEIISEASNVMKITLIKGENLGPARGFFELMKLPVKSDFVALADQDDIWLPDKLLRAVSKIGNNSNLPVMYCSNVSLYIDDFNTAQPTKLPMPSLPSSFFQNSSMGCTMVLNKAACKMVQRFSGNNMVMHDWYFFLVVLMMGKVCFDRNTTMYYRIHPRQAVGWKKNNKIRNIFSLVHLKQVVCQAETLLKELEQEFGTSFSDRNWAIFFYERASFWKKFSILFLGRLRLRDEVRSDFVIKLKLLLFNLQK
jgi:glycosyltransferase involved in cell wall biosynthesis